MPRYLVRTTATAIIEEHWLVEAPNEDAAKAVVDGEGEAAGKIIDVQDNTLGDEQDRDVCGIMRVPDDHVLTDDLFKKVEALRHEHGLAVVVITPEDIQSCGVHNLNYEPLISLEQAEYWLREHQRDVEEAILGDYWADSIAPLLNLYPIDKEKEPADAHE
jgi:hypothetical protein